MKSIVTIGGGTGSSLVLGGLRTRDVSLTSILSMADDGGSTGVLRRELEIPPPGDPRKYLSALADNPRLKKLLEYRFDRGFLKGHTAGNVFLAALIRLNDDNAQNAFKELQDFFCLDPSVTLLPASDEEMNLVITLENGEVLHGEDKLDTNEKIQSVGVHSISLNPSVNGNKDALDEITKADLVILGPGDLYGSLVPNFLVNGIVDALQKTKANLLYIPNLTNKVGITDHYSSQDWVEKIHSYITPRTIDYTIQNTKEIPQDILKNYANTYGSSQRVEPFSEEKNYPYTIIYADIYKNGSKTKTLSHDPLQNHRSTIHHNPDIIAEITLWILTGKETPHIIKIKPTSQHQTTQQHN